MAIRFWMVVAPLDRVLRLRDRGVVELGFGRRDGLEVMREADGVVFYSPRFAADPDAERLRSFTAIGRIAPGPITRDTAAPDRPWNRPVDFAPDVVATPVRPLVHALELTRDDPYWGHRLRRGLVELSRADFDTVRHEMRMPSADDRREPNLLDRVWY